MKKKINLRISEQYHSFKNEDSFQFFNRGISLICKKKYIFNRAFHWFFRWFFPKLSHAHCGEGGLNFDLPEQEKEQKLTIISLLKSEKINECIKNSGNHTIGISCHYGGLFKFYNTTDMECPSH